MRYSGALWRTRSERSAPRACVRACVRVQLCREIDEDLRSHIHSSLNHCEPRNPLKSVVRDLGNFSKLRPLRYV